MGVAMAWEGGGAGSIYKMTQRWDMLMLAPRLHTLVRGGKACRDSGLQGAASCAMALGRGGAWSWGSFG